MKVLNLGKFAHTSGNVFYYISNTVFFSSRPRNEIDGNKLEKTLPTSLGKLTDLTELVVGKNTPFLFSIFTTCTSCFI